jgi:sialic acid synthase
MMKNLSGGRVRKFALGDYLITDDSPPYVIAEIGHNHQGNLEKALQLIQAAADSGASAAKFQKRHNKTLFTPAAYNQVYNSENAFGETYGLHREALEFEEKEYKACIAFAKQVNIDFFATAFDFQSADFLRSLGVGIYKIASGDIRNLPLLRYIAGFGKPMIISTGGATLEEIDAAVAEVSKVHGKLAVLQCTASYPADYDQLNLQVIARLRDRYPHVTIGYSGHDNGIAMAVVAYALGARIIEKHFTLNRALKGTDHAFSLEPQGMKKMVRDLKRASVALGDGNKVVYESEKGPIQKMSKCIVASNDLNEGHVIQVEDIEFRSPGNGLPPAAAPQVIGQKTNRAIKQFTPITLEDFR